MIAPLRRATHHLLASGVSPVFAGSTAATLHLDPTRALHHPPPATLECLVEVDSDGLLAVEAQLRDQGFTRPSRGPLHRWRLGDLCLDVLSVDPEVQGIDRRFYARGFQDARPLPLAPGFAPRVLSPALTFATQALAVRDDGLAYPETRRELHDLVALLDGRPTLLEEIGSAADEVREVIVGWACWFHARPDPAALVRGCLTRGPDLAARQARVLALVDRLLPRTG